jgi:hypothetical protein
LRRALACLLVGGCSWSFGGDVEPLPLVGAPASVERAQQFTLYLGENLALVEGGGSAWAALLGSGGDGVTIQARLLRLGEPADEQTLMGAELQVSERAIYVVPEIRFFEDGQLQIFHAGDPSPRTFSTTQGPIVMMPLAGDTVLALQGVIQDTPLEILRTDGSFRRSITAYGQRGELIDHLGGWAFDAGTEQLITFENDGRVRAHATIEERTRELGRWGPGLNVEGGRGLLEWAQGAGAVVCGPDGLVLLPLDGSGARLLDGTCRYAGSARELPEHDTIFALAGDSVVYRAGAELRRARFDGAPPTVEPVAPDGRVIAIGPRAVAHTRDPRGRYEHDVVDGWIGDWRFMERGWQVAFSGDGARVYYIDHAADDDGTGDLMSAELDARRTHLLARNVLNWSALPDGRLIAVANRAFEGQQNRVIVVDEVAGRAQWVAAGVRGFMLIPGGREVLVDLVPEVETKLHTAARVAVPSRLQ